MSELRTRRHFSAEQKAQVVRRHLSGKTPVSDLADELKVQPSLIHLWVKQVLDQAEKAVGRWAGGRAAAAAGSGQGPEDRPARIEAGHQERSHRRTDGGECPRKKRAWGTLKGAWVPHDTRDAIVDYIGRWTERAELPAQRLLGWLELAPSKFHQWKDRYGKANEHNGKVPRDWWPGESRTRGLGETSHPRLPRQPSAERLPPLGVHDARLSTWWRSVPAACIGY